MFLLVSGKIMPHPWIPNSSPEVKKELLRAIGVADVLELFNDIPKELIVNRELNVGLGRTLSEYEVFRYFNKLISKNVVFNDPPPFMGGGVCAHYVPTVVRYLIKRSEFLTSYTPYQPEISQGLLQALFEYQDLIAELYGVEVVNASMYNGSTAAAEAVRMAIRVKKKRKVIMPLNVNPETYSVVSTWSLGGDIEIERVAYDKLNGCVDLQDLELKLSKRDVSAVYVENPNYFGAVEVHLRKLIEVAHNYDAMVIVNALPISLGLLEAPGKLGADIVVGDGQSLGLGMNFGGPSLGILGIRSEEIINQLPGRLVGATLDSEGRMGFTLILQTREQHIRREKATSNITTNSSLMALAAVIYLSLLGSNGIRRLGENILLKTYYAIKRLNEIRELNVPVFPKGVYFRELPVELRSGKYMELHKKLLSLGILGGKYIGDSFPELGETCLMCFTEMHTRSDIDLLASAIENTLRGG